MSQSIQSNVISEATIARIAGNILSGRGLPAPWDVDADTIAVTRAVAIARAIAAEVKRTAESGEADPHD